MDLGAHASFIVVAYAATVIVVSALVLWVAADHRAQRQLLADLEARGTARRAGRVRGP